MSVPEAHTSLLALLANFDFQPPLQEQSRRAQVALFDILNIVFSQSQVSLRKHVRLKTSIAANEISDQRFAEIIQVVGRSTDRSPGNYTERLEKESSKDNSLIPFLKRASDIDIESLLQLPTEWLQKLSAVNFADPVDISNLSYALTSDDVDDFDLVTINGVSFTVSAFPGALSLHPEQTQKSSAHSGLVSLSVEPISHITSCLEQDQSQPLPSLVLPIGQLQKRFVEVSGIPDLIDTDYFLVVDAAGTSHAVWLIYDRYQRFDKEFKDVADPKITPLVFVELGKNFDAAQVFPSVKDWLEAYGKVSEAKFQESIMKTGMVGEVRVRIASREDVAALETK
ncbi:uncharacterized protein FTJAE_630 [Fusarium tjaetaba]|uniref:Uncharacterized protein n=1 Tax=Fusarium tjaetaba TaxID=1567544 RepID=A0A8H5W7Y9_9HYPO|nr:uncharacterized protein FTJAE_630 [Fusarium tjaetaba]KAF5650206.1 hypothetical protein FTJAE_630 [Fusarium tjaetaba]